MIERQELAQKVSGMIRSMRQDKPLTRSEFKKEIKSKIEEGCNAKEKAGKTGD